MKQLLDVNLLVALFWQNHMQHKEALKWFLVHRAKGWATCCLTELGFIRVSMQVSGEKKALTFVDAQRTMSVNVKAPHHEFWNLDYSPSEMLPEIRERIRGHQQISDALLLDMAIRHRGKLVTFDKAITSLLPADSRHRSAIEIIHAG